jgi:hypothetical protein
MDVKFKFAEATVQKAREFRVLRERIEEVITGQPNVVIINALIYTLLRAFGQMQFNQVGQLAQPSELAPALCKIIKVAAKAWTARNLSEH